MKKKLKQKAAKGLHQVTVNPQGPEPGRALLSTALQTGANAAVPGLGTAIGMVDQASGLLKDENGLYKSRAAQALDQLNPVEAASRIGKGWGKVFKGDFKGAVGAFTGDQAERKAQVKEAENQRNYIDTMLSYAGTDATLDQNTQQFASGTEGSAATKDIEVEKDELVFRKVGGKFKLKADFKGGKTHAQGGEPYTAQEGDVIFPGKQRKNVLAALKNNDHRKLEGMRLKLPVDTNPQGKAVDGSGGATTTRRPNTTPAAPVNPGFNYALYQGEPLYADGQNRRGQYAGNEYQQAANSGNFLLRGQPGNPYPYGVAVAGDGSMYDHFELGAMAPRSSLNAQLPTMSRPATLPSAAANAAPAPQAASPGAPAAPPAAGSFNPGNLMQYASIANNLVQGLRKPEQVAENYLDPTLIQYQDRSEPQRRASRQAVNAQSANARNLGAGNAQVTRAVQSAAIADGQNRLMDIDNREQVRADQVRDANVGIQNQYAMYNDGKREQYQQLNAQARANQQAYLDAAAGQVAGMGDNLRQEEYMRSRDAKLDNLEQQKLGYLNQVTQYQIGADGQVVYRGGMQGTAASVPEKSVTQKVDSKGRTSSSTTIKTKRRKK